MLVLILIRGEAGIKDGGLDLRIEGLLILFFTRLAIISVKIYYFDL